MKNNEYKPHIMKKVIIILTTAIILIFSSITTIAQIKTAIPDEAHLLQNPFKPMNILVIPTSIEGIKAQQGDLVIAYDGLTCVGAAIVEDVNTVLNLVATSSDEVNKGYKSGQTIRLQYHSVYDNTVYDLIPQKILLGSMNYEELGTLYAEFSANVLSIEDLNSNTETKVYPNPVSQQLHIVLDNSKILASESIQLKLINITGSVVISNEYNTNQSVINLDVASLPSGEYTLLLISDNVKFTQKVIKLNY